MKICWHAVVVLWASLFIACQKVELPTTETVPSSGSDVSDSVTEDEDPVVLPDDFADEWTVAEVQEFYADVTDKSKELCSVVGYIVGYVKTTAIGSAVFSAEGAVETNILIADRKHETRTERCLPVQLVKGNDVRDDLNLADHPELLGMRLCITGYVSRYFKTVGLVGPEAYEWVKDGDDEPEEPQPDIEPDPVPKPLPDPEPEPEKEKTDTLKVDEIPTVIPVGRSIHSEGKEDE